MRVNCRFEFQLWDSVEHQQDGLVTLDAGRIDVNVWRQPHFGGEGDASAGNAGGIGLFQGELKVRGFDRFRYFLAQFREKLGNNAISGEPLAGAERRALVTP